MRNDRYYDIQQRLFTYGADSLSEANLLFLLLGSSRLAAKLTPVNDRWTVFDRASLIEKSRLSAQRAAQVLALIDAARRLSWPFFQRTKHGTHYGCHWHSPLVRSWKQLVLDVAQFV